MEKRLITKKAVYQVIFDYWQQYKAYPLQSLVAFILPAIGTILVIFIPPLILGRLVDIFTTHNGISFDSISIYIVLLAGLWLLGEVFWRVGMHFLIFVETQGSNSLAKLAVKRLLDRDYDFYTNHFTGSLTKKAISLPKSFEIVSDTLSFNVITNIFPIIFAVIILWQYSPWIPLILLACILTVIAIAIPIIRRRAALVAIRHDTSSRVSGRLSDMLANILAIKSFAKEKREEKVAGEYIDKFSSAFKKAADYQNLRFDSLISPIYVSTNVIGLIAAIFFAQKLHLQTGAIVVVFSYYSSVTRMFWEINRVYRNLESSITEAAEFTQMFIDPPKIRDVSAAKALVVKDSTIRFNQAGFKYDSIQDDEEDTDESFLNDFNLTVSGNQKIGLVGPSGSGKTTITKLLLRFVDLQSGSITIDDQDISKVTQASLREAIAYVSQEPLLFHRSLFENIAYGEENVTKDDVIRAAKIAHAHEFIVELPNGYDTMVGERGIKLSGGQRQRVAIARALLKKAPILILDEATSSLDSQSEKYIQDGLIELMKNKTAIVIAHRLSTIKNLDRIIVLDHGKIIQDGTHDELIKQDGIYAKLWSHQSGEFL